MVAQWCAKSGEELWPNQLTPEGKLHRILGIIQDVTRIRSTEEAIAPFGKRARTQEQRT